MGMQRCGADRIQAALAAGEAMNVVLVRRGCVAADALAAVEAARQAGALVLEASERDMWRMGEVAGADVLGLVGRDPRGGAEAVFRPSAGAVWVLAGVRYPSNIGYVIRTAEVSGAAGIVIDVDFTRRQRQQALRVSMGAHRFLPVLWMSAEDALKRAADAGFARVLLEDDGDAAPWEVDLAGDVALVVGAEDAGVPSPVRALCDVRVRVPMVGFVPSYSVQAPVAAVAVERLRQRAVGRGP